MWEFHVRAPTLELCDFICLRQHCLFTSHSSTEFLELPTASMLPFWIQDAELMYSALSSESLPPSRPKSWVISLVEAFQMKSSLLSATARQFDDDQSIRFKSRIKNIEINKSVRKCFMRARILAVF